MAYAYLSEVDAVLGGKENNADFFGNAMEAWNKGTGTITDSTYFEKDENLGGNEDDESSGEALEPQLSGNSGISEEDTSKDMFEDEDKHDLEDENLDSEKIISEKLEASNAIFPQKAPSIDDTTEKDIPEHEELENE